MILLIAVTGQMRAAENPPNLKVAKMVLCRNVENLEAVKSFDSQTQASGIPVALLITVTGDKETLAWVRKHKKIPFKHIWHYSSPISSDHDHEPIVAGHLDGLAKLAGEVEAKGFFDWRNYTVKRRLRPGHYEIRIERADGETLTMDDGSPAIIHFDYQP